MRVDVGYASCLYRCPPPGAQLWKACYVLGQGLAGLSARFQRDLARELDGPWMMSTGEDFRSPEVAREFYRAMHMLVPVSALMRPGFVLRVLRKARVPVPSDVLDQAPQAHLPVSAPTAGPTSVGSVA